MNILIYGINFFPELTGTGKYTGEMAFWFAENGHNVKIITAPPYYPEWHIHKEYSALKYKSQKLGASNIIRCPLYIPEKLSTIKRLIHLSSFAITSFFPLMMQLFWKPDVIIVIVPTLLCVPAAKLLSFFTKSKFILHVQDYEIDAMLGLGMANRSWFTKLAKLFEMACLKSADSVSSISNTMLKNALLKGVEKKRLIFFPNWSEIERFNNVEDVHVANLRDNLKLAIDKKIILYSGNIGEKQGLEIVIDVAERLKEDNYLFVLIGQGAGKEKLECTVKHKNIKNIVFRPLQSYEKLPALLKLADCHLVIQKKGAADAVLPSKLTNILAVGGNAVITAEKDTELGQLCENNPGIAVLVEPESIDSLLNGIVKALTLPAYNSLAQSYARNFLDKNAILIDFISNISK
jgi:colanic acid biosynthesis glycosyl transferase WcaI